MNTSELCQHALQAFPESRDRVNKYFNLLEWVKHYEKLMDRPDSPWVCSGYNNAKVNLDKFRKRHPDISRWIEDRLQGGVGTK